MAPRTLHARTVARLGALLGSAALVGGVALHDVIPHAGLHTALAAVVQQASCAPAQTPIGALPPALPIWFAPQPLPDGPPTAQATGNRWVDDWEHHLSNAALGAGYTTFVLGNPCGASHFRHNEHWMVDLAGGNPDAGPHWGLGGTAMRPNATFQAVNGTLTVETDVAAGVADYGGFAWPELTITTAAAPGDARPTSSDIYVYDRFPNAYTAGCRLQSNRQPICALFDNTTRGPGQGGRIWEISHFQNGASNWGAGASTRWGGDPTIGTLGTAWRVCRGTDPDTNCRDRFRWELSKDRSALYVNGVLYMEHKGFPAAQQVPDALLTGPVYVYFGEKIVKPPSGATVRFHWDRLAVNAGAASVPPTPVVLPTATAVVGATPTPSPGLLTVTFDDRAGQNQALTGQYPAGILDWGSGQWFHAGPFGAFTTKSVSFTSGRTSSTVTLVSPRRLDAVQAYNGGVGAATVTLTCGAQTFTQSVGARALVTLTPAWTQPCTALTVGSSNGWDTNLDNFVWQ